MHLGNGAVTPMCAVVGLAAGAIGVGAAALLTRKAQKVAPSQLAAATALVFAAQALNIPVTPYASGHLVGTFLLARWFGAGWATIAMTIVLAVQSLLLGDGGTLALGLNVLNMAILPGLIVYPLWTRYVGTNRFSIAAGAGCSVVVAALIASVELRQTSPALLGTMLGIHAAIGILEAALTFAALSLLDATRPLRTSFVGAAVLVAAMFGSSPWPDGLEYSLQLHGLASLLSEGGSESLLMPLVACAAALGAAAVLAHLAGKRGLHAAAN